MARQLRRHTLMAFPGLSLVFHGLITFEWSTIILWLILGCPGKFYTHAKLPGGPRSLSEHYSVVRGSPPSVKSEWSRRITSSKYLRLTPGFGFKYWLIDSFLPIFMLMFFISVIIYFFNWWLTIKNLVLSSNIDLLMLIFNINIDIFTDFNY